MCADRLSKEYENGVLEFVKFVVEHVEDPNRMKCPCLGWCYVTDTYDCDRVDEIAEALEEDIQDCPKMFESLVSDADKPLYKDYPKFTRLSAVLKLYNLKARSGWSDKSFTELLALLRDMLPEDNVLPNWTYDVTPLLNNLRIN